MTNEHRISAAARRLDQINRAAVAGIPQENIRAAARAILIAADEVDSLRSPIADLFTEEDIAFAIAQEVGDSLPDQKVRGGRLTTYRDLARAALSVLSPRMLTKPTGGDVNRSEQREAMRLRIDNAAEALREVLSDRGVPVNTIASDRDREHAAFILGIEGDGESDAR